MSRALAERILTRAARPGGVSRSEVNWNLVDRKYRNDIIAVFDGLLKSGEIVCFTRPAAGGGSGQPAKQYFSNRADGERWAGLVVRRPPKPRIQYVAVPLTVSSKRSRAVALEADAAPIVPKHVKVTVLPSAPVYARHQLPPGAVVPSVVNPAECRPWAAGLK